MQPVGTTSHEQNRPFEGGALAQEKRDNTAQMAATNIEKEQRTRIGNRSRTDLPWNVILHNDWDNSMPRVVIILKKCIPGMTYEKAARIMFIAHTRGRAVVKSCHKELAELYEERLRAEGLSASIEKAG
jgi:ATP-dependent Clp protease adaptor protein ClpS